jgi:hypothetical protein
LHRFYTDAQHQAMLLRDRPALPVQESEDDVDLSAEEEQNIIDFQALDESLSLSLFSSKNIIDFQALDESLSSFSSNQSN